MDIVPRNNLEPRVPSCTCYCETNYSGSCPNLCHLHGCMGHICVIHLGD